MINDAHCHFFSSRFLELLAPERGRADEIAARLQWDRPGTPTELGDRWVAELDRHGVVARRADREHSRRRGVGRRGGRAASGTGSSASSCTTRRASTPTPCWRASLTELQMQRRLPLSGDARLSAGRRDASSACFAPRPRSGAAVFAHCGVLTVGVRKKLGLPSRFDLRLGDPLALARTALGVPAGAGDHSALRRRATSAKR